ncbi:ribosome maturation factor RimM [Plasmodium gonderi]|uniref:Ribosome maturation factor RimM n=1 Tax=Plasmodium gonderi TaxID=77519 RepID=A0A1Y1JCR2_PLAGO|nr:ribosome maturation factor RimM [Plasmodium gonderi]GAW80020.1 ribosome maturation factor RimM [Plasmodium gonderi]
MKRCFTILKRVIIPFLILTGIFNSLFLTIWSMSIGRKATRKGYTYVTLHSCQNGTRSCVTDKSKKEALQFYKNVTTRHKKRKDSFQNIYYNNKYNYKNREVGKFFFIFKCVEQKGTMTQSEDVLHTVLVDANKRKIRNDVATSRIGRRIYTSRCVETFSLNPQNENNNLNHENPSDENKSVISNEIRECTKSADQQRNEEYTREFLTDTKYYKRSKYSKAGYIKRRTSENLLNTWGKNDNFLQKNVSEDQHSTIQYIESENDILTDITKKSVENESKNLPNLFIKNYYADRTRSNNLDLVLEKDKFGTSTRLSKKNNCESDVSVSREEGRENQENSSAVAYNNKISFMNEFTVIGEIVGVHGLHGWLKVISFTTFNDIRFKNNAYRYLFMNTYPYPLPIKIVDVKESLKVGFLYLKIEGINSRTDALKLKSCLICDDKKKFPGITENQYISTDLLNFHIYIFNDLSNTSIGKVHTFVSKHDYICKKSVQNIADDLIQIEINKNISLQKVFRIISASQMNAMCNPGEETSPSQQFNPIRVLINRKNFSFHGGDSNERGTEMGKLEHDEERVKGDKNYYDSIDNFEGCSYKKIYKCDFCDDVYANVQEASEHENSHFRTDDELLFNASQESLHKKKLYEVDKNTASKLKQIDYFFIPIVKEKTIRSVNYELKQIYLDISTVFLLDDQKKTKDESTE